MNNCYYTIAVALSLAAPAGEVVLPDLDPKDVASSFLGCPVIWIKNLHGVLIRANKTS